MKTEAIVNESNWRVAGEMLLRYADGSECEVLHVRDESGTVAWVPAGFPERAVLVASAPDLLKSVERTAEVTERFITTADVNQLRAMLRIVQREAKAALNRKVRNEH